MCCRWAMCQRCPSLCRTIRRPPKLFCLSGGTPLIPHTLRETCPSCFSISPRRADRREDLPHPTWPTTATREGSGMAKLMLEEKEWPIQPRLPEGQGSRLP